MAWMPLSRRTAATIACGLAAVAALPAAASAQGCASADARPTAANGAAIADATLCLVNAERSARGLAALAAAPELAQAAAGHSGDMVARRYFDHTSPDGGTVTTRVKATGYLHGYRSFQVRENIAWGSGPYATPASTVRMWMDSPPHRASILATSVREVGAGVAKGAPTGGRGATYTMVFGARGR